MPTISQAPAKRFGSTKPNPCPKTASHAHQLRNSGTRRSGRSPSTSPASRSTARSARAGRPPASAQLAQGQNLAAFITFARGVNPETTGKAPRWLLRLILPVAIRKREREQKYRLLPTAIREHTEAARLDNTYPCYRDIAAGVLLMASKDATASGAGRASQALLPVLATATFTNFPALDHFGPEKKPKQIAQAVASSSSLTSGRPVSRTDRRNDDDHRRADRLPDRQGHRRLRNRPDAQ